MKPLGPLIERRRLQLGLSRADLGKRLGVTTQTVRNIELNPSYNLGTSLLGRLENALHVTFDVVMKETPMSVRIQMGNEEFILYIRKNHPDCETVNKQLGKRVWQWLRDHDETAGKVGNGEAVPCLWGEDVAAGLPRSATQFHFDRSVLPALYDFLDQLGSA